MFFVSPVRIEDAAHLENLNAENTEYTDNTGRPKDLWLTAERGGGGERGYTRDAATTQV
jgi:hypothetical protein